MDLKQVEDVANRYYSIVTSVKSVVANRLPDSMMGIPFSLLGSDRIHAHLAWMCVVLVQEIIKEGKTDKAMRWIGFLQGALWVLGLRSIEQMKFDNMPEHVTYDSSRV